MPQKSALRALKLVHNAPPASPRARLFCAVAIVVEGAGGLNTFSSKLSLETIITKAFQVTFVASGALPVRKHPCDL